MTGKKTMNQPTLHFLCGKMAAGKSTLAKRLAEEHSAILISEDIWLQRLYPDEIRTFEDYVKYSRRLKAVAGPHVEELLKRGMSVVLDFPANVPVTREWIRGIFERAGADHLLHFVDTANDACLERLAKRNRELPEGSKEMSETEFEAITALFVAPTDAEGFKVRRYP